MRLFQDLLPKGGYLGALRHKHAVRDNPREPPQALPVRLVPDADVGALEIRRVFLREDAGSDDAEVRRSYRWRSVL